MEIQLNRIQSLANKPSFTLYMVLGVVSDLKKVKLDESEILITDRDNLNNYFPESKIPEVSNILDNGYYILLSNRYLNSKDDRNGSYLTPLSSTKSLPTTYSGRGYVGEILESNLIDPRKFIQDKTYILQFEFNPNQIPDRFYLNLPSDWSFPNSIISEFISPICVYDNLTADIDQFNEVYNIKVTGTSMLDKFTDLVSIYNESIHSSIIGCKLRNADIKEVSEDKYIVTFYFNKPVSYIPDLRMSEWIDVSVSFGLYENIRFLSDYIPDGLITYKSKFLGDSSDIKLKVSDGTLTVSMGNVIEEFSISGDRHSSNFVGYIQSNLIEVITGPYDSFEIYDVDEYFINDPDLGSLNILDTISHLVDSVEVPNGIVLSEGLTDFDLRNIHLDLSDQFLFTWRSTDLDQLKLEIPNLVKFVGTLDGYPSYLQFLRNIFTCNFGKFLDGIPEVPESDFDFEIHGIYHPKSDLYYNSFLSLEFTNFMKDLGIDLNKVTIFHLIFSTALSKFLTRYKLNILFLNRVDSISKLNELMNLMKIKFSIYNSILIESYSVDMNKVSLSIKTELEQILKYNKISLNLKLIWI